MGILTDSVETIHGVHHFAIRSTCLSWRTLGFGIVCTLYVDGRRCDERTVFPGQSIVLACLVNGELVLAEVKQGLTSTCYRLCVGEVEVLLHVEPGSSGFSVDLPPPSLASVLRTRLPLSERP